MRHPLSGILLHVLVEDSVLCADGCSDSVNSISLRRRSRSVLGEEKGNRVGDGDDKAEDGTESFFFFSGREKTSTDDQLESGLAIQEL